MYFRSQFPCFFSATDLLYLSAHEKVDILSSENEQTTPCFHQNIHSTFVTIHGYACCYGNFR